ncbi:hypothetical protein LCGC14_0775450 [marine sediment metagenome]|uniref:Uncharacterized protein n=1 Tax=marine sediment metagenome TaxID=412755 RepID=A0A0F9PX79_9ZZZZ
MIWLGMIGLALVLTYVHIKYRLLPPEGLGQSGIFIEDTAEQVNLNEIIDDVMAQRVMDGRSCLVDKDKGG